MDTPKHKTADGIPDMRYINQQIAILEVARHLGLRVESTSKIHCWRPERHQHGDRTASVGIRKLNNTVKCFGCDSGPMGPIDLVIAVLGLTSAADAAEWIAQRWPVPRIPKGRRLTATAVRGRAGYEGPFGLLIRSGLWSRLSAPTRAVAPVLYEFSEGDDTYTRTVQLSYAAITRYSGVKSPNAIRKALIELADVGWLRPQQQARPIERLNAKAPPYILSPHSDQLNELAQNAARQTSDEIRTERELRARKRRQRQAGITIAAA